MNIIDFPIERINEFLSDHSFVVTKPLGENIEIGGNVTIKVKLTGIKPMISVGDWKDFIEYTIIIEDIDDSLAYELYHQINGYAEFDSKDELTVSMKQSL